jgi:N6-adenosine-specific RNA methylase IME4
LTRYATIVADPPWQERGSGKVKRGADRHYPLMDTNAIVYLMQQTLTWSVEESAHMYLWVTNTFLPDGLEVMQRIGFRYVTNVVWSKGHFGIGRYFRGQHELCLFGVRGRGFDVITASKSLTSVIHGDHRRDSRGQRVHSGKPKEFYELVEARSKGPYLEMFARSERPGWDAWGNQAPNGVAL